MISFPPFRALPLLVLVLVPTPGTAQGPPPPPPTIASLGSCQLGSGAVIPNCRIAYRAFGRLNASRTNAVLIPTWLLGRSEEWIGLLGPAQMIDTTRFYTILVDALANGRSSSPSNTAPEGRSAFERLTIADMVEAQHRFVVENLKLPQLHAVVGISMGGMQAFEWAVRYPDFLDVVIPIAGSPRVAPYDEVLWTTEVSLIENARRGGITDDSIWTAIERIGVLMLRTPIAVDSTPRVELLTGVRNTAAQLLRDWTLDDFVAQVRAVRQQDVSAPYDADMARAAARVRARMLIVYSWEDHMVTAGAAAAFARLVHADTLSLHSACGHLAAGCEDAVVNPAVRAFLAR